MSDLRAGFRALITEYGRDGGNDDLDDVLDRAIALIESDGVLLTSQDALSILRWKRAYDHRYGRNQAEDNLDARIGAAL